MKNQAIQYLAFDLDQATCELSLRDPSGTVVMRGTVPTESEAVLRVVKGAGPRVRVGFEEGTQAQWLHDLVVPNNERVIVCNLRGEKKPENKSHRSTWTSFRTDCTRAPCTAYPHGTPAVLDLKELVRS